MTNNKNLFISYAKTVYGQDEIDAVVKCFFLAIRIAILKLVGVLE